MKIVLLSILLIINISGYGQVKSFDYAYHKGLSVDVYSVSSKTERQVVVNGPIHIPDGTKVAYTAFDNGSDRFIEIVDLTIKIKS